MVSLAIVLMIVLAVVRHVRRHAKVNRTGSVLLALIGAGGILQLLLWEDATYKYAGPILFFLADFYLTGKARQAEIAQRQAAR